MQGKSKRKSEEVEPEKIKKRRPPGSTLESKEKELISLSYEEAKRQILAKQATSQLLTHFLKLGSTRERLEKQKIQGENKLLEAKVESIQSQKRTEVLYADALKAMRVYSGQKDEDPDI